MTSIVENDYLSCILKEIVYNTMSEENPMGKLTLPEITEVVTHIAPSYPVISID